MQDELNFEGVEKQPLRTFTEKAYLDYSMYVILDRALPSSVRRPEARAAPHHLRHERARPLGRPEAQEVRAHRRRRDRQVPSARRLGLLRSHGAHGAGFLLPLSDRRRAGQLGLARRSEVLRGHALHRVEAHALRRSAAVRALGWHGRLAAELRRHAGRAGVPAGATAERAAQRHAGHRGRHVHRHSAAQSARNRAGVHPPAG